MRRLLSRRIAGDRERFRLLADLAEVADGRRSLGETADQVCALLVPNFADLCMVDVVQRGGLRRLAVKAWGAGGAERETQLRTRGPTTPDTPGSGHAVANGEPQLIAPVTDELIRAGARDERDVAMLRSLRMRASVVVPLIARGRALGALTLVVTGQSRRRYRTGDLEFVRVLSGRVALALDNAGLYRAADGRGAVDGSAGRARRGGHHPEPEREPHLRQPGRGRDARCRDAAGDAGASGGDAGGAL